MTSIEPTDIEETATTSKAPVETAYRKDKRDLVHIPYHVRKNFIFVP